MAAIHRFENMRKDFAVIQQRDRTCAQRGIDRENFH
jgi:hypothetical protein